MQLSCYTIGMNMKIYVQTTLNAKRKKRKGKKVKLITKPKLPRVIYILKTGKLKDRTHYREIDPYWGIMWRQYEYLRYLELYLKKIVSNAIDENLLNLSNDYDKEIFESYISLLQEIIKKRKKLVHWLFNAFYIQIGGVLSSRFYGWKDDYAEKFVSKFYEIASDLIQKLRFDIDKTRCSVYFYQAFWLGGLSVINEIRQKLYTEKTITPNYNRGTKIFSFEEFEDFDNIDFVSKYIEDFSDYGGNEIKIKDEDKTQSTIDIDLEKKDEEISLSTIDSDIIHDEQNELNAHQNEQEMKIQAIHVLRRLIKKAGIPLDTLYNIDRNEKKENRFISLIAKKIKKKLKKNELTLTNEEKLILSNYLGRIII